MSLATVDGIQMAEKLEKMTRSSSWSWTDSKTQTLTHTWAISNLSNCMSWEHDLGTGAFTSGGTPAGGPEETSWKLKLVRNHSQSFCSVYLCLEKAKKPIRAGYTFCIQDKAGVTKTVIVGRDKWFREGEQATNFRGWKAFFEKNADETGLLPEDFLHVTCVVHIKNLVKTESGTFLVGKKPSCTMVKDFGTLLKEGNFYDAVIEAGERVFPVHKGILAARSPVFRAMFAHDTLENRENSIKIPDLSAEVVGSLLQYVYTGSIADLDANTEDSCCEILRAADKYDMQNLKIMCEVSLTSRLSVQNATQMFALALAHHVTSFKLVTAEYIVKNFSEVTKTDSWISLTSENPEIMQEILKLCFDEKRDLSTERGLIIRKPNVVRFL